MKSIVQQLDHIFKPESIAVLGASKDPIKWGNRILRHIKQGGFQGKLYPINPSYDEILNLHSYPSVLDTPDNVEMAIITLPASKVPQAMLECVQKGIKGALIVTAGFAEVGNEGKLLQNKVVEIARKGGIRFVGPNCMGIWSAAGNLNLCFREAPRPGFIAFVSQSGTYGGYLSEIANSRGYGLSKFINIGNQADISASEYLDYLVDDEEVKVIIFYIEGFSDGRRFFEVAREAVKKKPIIIYKGGQTEAGARATLSHTGSLAGSQEVFEAVCRQVGIIRAQEATHSFEMAESLIYQPLPRGRRIAIMGSGGQCVILSDVCIALGLEIPEFDPETTRKLQELLPPHAPPAKNPIDFAGSYRTIREEVLALEKLLNLDYIDGVITNAPTEISSRGAAVVLDKPTPTTTSSSPQDIARFAALPKIYNKPVVVIRFPTENAIIEANLQQAGMPIYDTAEQCARAMYALVEYAKVRGYLID